LKPGTRRYLASLAAGVALGAALFIGRGGLALREDRAVYQALCDACFVPAAALLSIGLLVFVANDGLFDIFGFTIMRATAVFHSREARAALPKTYYDYHRMKHDGRKADSRFLLFSGLTLLALAFAFLLLFETAA